jgi:hypothetical protein
MAEQLCPFCGKVIASTQAHETHCPHCREPILVARSGDWASVTGPGAAPQPVAAVWARWGWVRLGLTVWFWGFLLLAVLVLAGYISFFLITWLKIGGEEGRDSVTAGVNVVLQAVCVAAAVPNLLGVILCCAAPRQAGTQLWAVLLLVFAVLAGGALLLLQLGLPEVASLPTIFLVLLFLTLGGAALTLVLRALARHRGDPALGADLVAWFCWALVYPLLSGARFLLAKHQPQDRSENEYFRLVADAATVCEVVVSLIVFAWGARLLWRLRDVIPFPPRQSVARPPSEKPVSISPRKGSN